MRTQGWLALLVVLLLPSLAAAADAYTLDVSGSSYDEECLTYCLQGLVNRDAPRLFLDTSAFFWSNAESDRAWMDYLSREKGFKFTQIDSLRLAVQQFKGDLKGLVLYDPNQDASRYLALTVAAQRNLLAVTDAMLRYETPALRGSHWTADDFSNAALWHVCEAKVSAGADGLRVTEDSPALSYAYVDRTVSLDLAATPFLEITVPSCTAQWALKVNEGTAVDECLEAGTAKTGTLRYDLREHLKRPKGRVLVRIFTVGEGSTATFRNLRFLDPQGKPVASTEGSEVDCFAGLPVVEDFRGRFTDDLVAYRWALDNLMPGCTRKMAFDAGHTHPGTWLGGDMGITIGLDIAIARKAFIFNLSPAAIPFDSYGRRDETGYPAQAEIFDRIMSRLDRPAGIYGWSEPEYLYVDRASRDGNYLMCCGAPNTSFWAKVPVSHSLRLPTQAPRTKPLESKYYVMFQTNEGDTPKILAARQGGAWDSDKRGSIPVAWGVDPVIAREFPALWEFYVATATPNDTFYTGCSGGGYALPWRMPNADDYFRHVGALRKMYGPGLVDIWESGYDPVHFARYRDLAGVRGFTQQTQGPAVNEWLDDGTPILMAESNLYYFDLTPGLKADDPAGDLAARIQTVAAAHQPPFFIVCYGGVGKGFFDLIRSVQQKLPADGFEVVGADHFIDLARAAGQVTASLGAQGVAPGGTVDLNLALRNPDGGDAGEAGAATWTLPEGWSARETQWQHGAVPKGQCLRHHVTLTAGGAVGAAVVKVRDERTGMIRTAGIDVYAASQIVSDFSSRDGWEEAGATLRVADGKGIITTPGPYACVKKRVDIDFDRGPVLEISVPAVEGLWALKVNDGTLPVDILLQPDTKLTGRRTYDLSHLRPEWNGRRGIDVIIFAIVPNTSVTVDEVRLHYRR